MGVDSAGVTRTGWLRSARNEQFILSGLTVVISIAVAYGAIGFREFIGLVQLAFYVFSSENVATLARELAWWHVLLAPVPGAPISTIMIVFKLTGDYSVTLAAMVAVVVASVVTHQVLGKSFFLWQLERQGLSFKGGRSVPPAALTEGIRHHN